MKARVIGPVSVFSSTYMSPSCDGIETVISSRTLSSSSILIHTMIDQQALDLEI